MTASAALSRLGTERLIMVVRGAHVAAARAAIDAAVAGGLRAVEVTFTVPGALELIRKVRDAHPDVLVGAGTVVDPMMARDAVDAGARFLVSPGLDERVVALARERDILMLPGVLTPTEVQRALAAGALAVKLFPADALGPRYLRALAGPFPQLAVVPSGGISAADAGEWIAAGALAVGVGGGLSPAAAEPDTAAVRQEAERLLAAVHVA
ncbi:bifunctional 4-hydroxy-2-oxoglutarate aldolase/2-dehydro-3-deoxy-phosphogluconate aldolase [Microbacterium sp. Marseille-Q6965]|uniref:bifunctional 4-hydroxy-2-oxoglutarate aldolase/2-dehydro-3-deoxy-phosphogluconate aldolase n=1 Tax=Microbacterium sp. Marseille-Q6965 TaxID=2965072 RepID=UPI0021B83D2F|nr:bifunctional 4-hydroxy-2-oxoglutarate aldolase/2-dehydro-3-deoxy-phosphogluconate aldolase [Microbacterium sp. Marseille-Q6965]